MNEEPLFVCTSCGKAHRAPPGPYAGTYGFPRTLTTMRDPHTNGWRIVCDEPACRAAALKRMGSQ